MTLLDTLRDTFGVKLQHPVDYWKALINEDLALPGYTMYTNGFNLVQGTVKMGRNVQLGPFTYIRGPVYIGNNVKIGPYVELTRCIVLDDTIISHKNVIVDSVIGPNVWMAGFVATCNRRLDDKPVQVKYKGDTSNSGGKFGAVIDRGGRIGAGVMLKPGIYVESNQTIRLPKINYEAHNA